MLRGSTEDPHLVDNQFEGFCVDLLREMALLLGFRFELRLGRDGTYGECNERGEWNGLVREVMDRVGLC